MEEISNRTIAALLVVAMVISLSGTFLSLSKLNAVQSGTYTGFATAENGTAKLNILSSTSIKFDVPTINWTNGTVNASYSECNLSTTNYPAYTAGCVGFASPRPGPLLLENDGNQNVNVTIQASANAGGWIGGTSPAAYIKASNNESNSCDSGATFLQTSTSFTTTYQVLCSNFTYDNTRDTINIDMLVTVPQNAPSGPKSVQVEANATAV